MTFKLKKMGNVVITHYAFTSSSGESSTKQGRSWTEAQVERTLCFMLMSLARCMRSTKYKEVARRTSSSSWAGQEYHWLKDQNL